MKLRRQKPADSPDMLLDTMCNAFGGIILLAVLVTRLTRQERHSMPASASEAREITERRLALARTNLEQSRNLSARLQAEAEDPRIKQQVARLQARNELEQERRTVQAVAADLARTVEALSATDPSARASQLNAELLAAKFRLTAQQKSLAATIENRSRLPQRLADLERQSVTTYNEIGRGLRLPKEHETGQGVVYIIVQYGRVYPCWNFDLSQNEISTTWRESGSSSTATPIPSFGMDPLRAPGMFQTYLQNLRGKGVYLAFLVYEDSFAEFIRAKQMARATGYAVGWKPYRKVDGPIIFDPAGSRPKPQ